jgi:xylulokinase
MLLLGIDIGTSSVKASVVDVDTKKSIAQSTFPDIEAPIISKQTGWAEQSPNDWWNYVRNAIKRCHASGSYNPKNIAAIGLSYQMHGLVCVDKNQEPIRDAIIWCDSRSVEIGERAFKEIGEDKCMKYLLNSPGNFTASKLFWVKQAEPSNYNKIDKVMLPGDFIAMKLTGEIGTTITGMSEGVLWDFEKHTVSEEVTKYFGFEPSFFPKVKDVFIVHGLLQEGVANDLSLRQQIPISYKAGDQPNNAFSLNVMHAGEVAATAGTSGVVYAVSDKKVADRKSRINTFAHVNHTAANNSLGLLMCINGAGVMNRWLKSFGFSDYRHMNELALRVAIGSQGLFVFPFGNGAERIFGNRLIGASLESIDLNKHSNAHLCRATQEGIAFSFRYGFDILNSLGIEAKVIKAGRANMFLSDVFVSALANIINVPVSLYPTDGSAGAALGAGVGAGLFSVSQAFENTELLDEVLPNSPSQYEDLYGQWKEKLEKKLTN